MGANRVKAGIGGDAVEPRPQGGTLLEPRKPAPRCQQSLLEHVFGVGQRTQHAVAVSQQLPAVRVGERAKCLLVAGASTLERFSFEPGRLEPCLFERCLFEPCLFEPCLLHVCSMPLCADRSHLCRRRGVPFPTVAVST